MEIFLYTLSMRNKTALITGWTSWIGLGIAKKFAECGINLILTYFHDEQRAKKVQTELEEVGVKIVTIQADTWHRDNIEEVFLKLKRESIGLDILVNNIWASFPDSDDWQGFFDHHMMWTVYPSELFSDQIAKEGVIINISSILGIDPLMYHKWARLEAYCCMKSAVNTYTKLSANKYAGKIRVNAIAPWNTETTWWEKADSDFKEARRKDILIGRFVDPAEIGQMAAQIVENKALNGQIFVVDGGVVGNWYSFAKPYQGKC